MNCVNIMMLFKEECILSPKSLHQQVSKIVHMKGTLELKNANYY